MGMRIGQTTARAPVAAQGNNRLSSPTREERAVADRIKKALGGDTGGLVLTEPSKGEAGSNQETDHNYGPLVLSEKSNNPMKYYVKHQSDGKCLVTVQDVTTKKTASVLLNQGDGSDEKMKGLINSARNLAYHRAEPEILLAQVGYSDLLKKQSGVEKYVIQTGDTLSQIARKFGVDQGEIELLNPGLNPQKLQIGTKLLLPFYNVNAQENLGEVASKLGFIDPKIVEKWKKENKSPTEIGDLVKGILNDRDDMTFGSFISDVINVGSAGQKTSKIRFPTDPRNSTLLDEMVLEGFGRIGPGQYVVGVGENWGDLARDLGVNERELRSSSRDGRLIPGTTLTVPMPPSK